MDNNMPQHIAIILDGNRRWARQRGLDIKQGHKQGADTLINIVKYANKIGLKYITVYAFSTENWKRTEDEVGALMFLFESYMDDFYKRADSGNVKINVIGNISGLSDRLQKSIYRCMEKTKDNTGTTFNIAINYGGRDELVKATQKIASRVKSGEIEIDEIDEDMISDSIYTAGQPDPDLLIRTSGELRTSNFLPWQLVYSEFLFLDKNWPDFSEEDLDEAIRVYQSRNKRMGK